MRGGGGREGGGGGEGGEVCSVQRARSARGKGGRKRGRKRGREDGAVLWGVWGVRGVRGGGEGPLEVLVGVTPWQVVGHLLFLCRPLPLPLP